MASNLPILRTATLRGAVSRRTNSDRRRTTPTIVGQLRPSSDKLRPSSDYSDLRHPPNPVGQMSQ